MTDKEQHIVIVGGGQAGAQVIDSLRRRGSEAKITLVSEEAMLPYQRPPLSKQYLSGQYGPDWLLYRPADFYPATRADTVLGLRAAAINRDKKRLELADGRLMAYDKLVLTTGCRARRLPVPGAELEGVYYLRDIDDVNNIRRRLDSARRVVIIGGGFIGLEVAAVLVKSGREVTVLEAQDRVLPRVVAPVISDFFAQYHQAQGVRIATGVQVSEIQVADGGLSVSTVGGEEFGADLVIVGIGVWPNIELASDAGLTCDNGICVDEFGRTSDEDIFAAGDCTNHPNSWLVKRLRLETVHNAVEQAKTVAATLAGDTVPYRQVPWVWSDQYGLRLQAVGVSDDYDRLVTRGNPADGRFSVFYYQGDRLMGLNAVNRPADFGACRRLLNEGIALAPEQAADATLDLRSLLPRKVHFEFDPPWPVKSKVAVG